jgi:hypothetical protein
MEFDLLEEVFGGAKSTHYQDVLESGKNEESAVWLDDSKKKGQK